MHTYVSGDWLDRFPGDIGPAIHLWDLAISVADVTILAWPHSSIHADYWEVMALVHVRVASGLELGTISAPNYEWIVRHIRLQFLFSMGREPTNADFVVLRPCVVVPGEPARDLFIPSTPPPSESPECRSSVEIPAWLGLQLPMSVTPPPATPPVGATLIFSGGDTTASSAMPPGPSEDAEMVSAVPSSDSGIKVESGATCVDVLPVRHCCLLCLWH